MHWHDQLELIYVLEGTCSIEYDTTCTLVYPGELAIIHCNENHKVQAHSNLVHYYCLILSPLDYRPLPFVLENTCFRRIIRSSAVHGILLHIVDELNTRSEYFQIIVKSLITQLIIDLLRHHTVEPTSLTTLPSSKDPK
ncbi:MAG: cupin domain-containing protein, partial [Cellulosilyticaceae bacterium]